ncbi:plasma-membrane proton-efflux P-type ATPase [Crocosphaera sp. XPORK-15E]|uniref:plasma-membrane proton-efflux P-type ATPase n=1 Tax=Crocosphaera sp. XPORK-15E TaxID=3110247 RepID=UPI002B1EA7E0|nr:plasma-membrane proton-efflux P-type ATPase [Crocosphaera sp. XPORK-15E]MEA5532953.1 plasma-membrane proton-efflux P-type ATPase [Crocosphaera sp. XPORK-15E]
MNNTNVLSSDLSLPDLMKQLGTSPNGLNQTEVESRLSQYGYNELAEKTVNPLIEFLSYFWGPIPWMIEAAVILSALVGDWTDFGIILLLLIGNSVIGFWEEKSAGDAVAALKSQLALNATAKREGHWTTVPARELVPGDIIRLKIGDVLPADGRLLDCDPLKIDQASLTGESLPVTHKTGDQVYSGSILKQGQAEAVVNATGVNTFFGKTAKLVAETDNVSHFQKAVLKIGDFLIIAAIALVGIILFVRLYEGDRFFSLLKFCLVLTVASVPVAMPTVLSISMAVGAQNLAKKDVVVTRLSSIEELAGMDMLCSDKTGTLTLNQLTLGDPYTLEGVNAEEMILAAALASQSENEDPIDLTVIAGLKDQTQLQEYQILHFTPFDPVSKRTEAQVKDQNGKTFNVAKGAPQVILSLVVNTADIEGPVNQVIEDYAKKGYRALGVARTNDLGQWQFLGILSLFDPPRPDSKITIEAARRFGVPVKMVTGDQVLIARETCRQLGLGQNILDAEMLRNTPASQLSNLNDKIEQADGFGQVFPEDKYHIVDVLKHRGHIVGMTGDGVNDAPALKKADVGIAVSGATDAARAAADIVLLAPGLSVIIDAIRLSRQIFARMTSYTIYRVVETIRVLVFTTLAILFFNSYPLTAVMIVFLALLNDGALVSIAYDRAPTSQTPQSWDMTRTLGISAALGLICVFETFILYYLAEKVFTIPKDLIPTLVYLNLAVGGMMTIYATRVEGPFWSMKPGKALLLSTGTAALISTLMAIFGIFIPGIGFPWTAASWGYAFIWFLVIDRAKLVLYAIFDQKKSIFAKKYLERWQRFRM